MRPFVSPTLPTTRRVRVVVLERDLANAVEIVGPDPLDSPAELASLRPLPKRFEGLA